MSAAALERKMVSLFVKLQLCNTMCNTTLSPVNCIGCIDRLHSTIYIWSWWESPSVGRNALALVKRCKMDCGGNGIGRGELRRNSRVSLLKKSTIKPIQAWCWRMGWCSKPTAMYFLQIMHKGLDCALFGLQCDDAEQNLWWLCWYHIQIKLNKVMVSLLCPLYRHLDNI